MTGVWVGTGKGRRRESQKTGLGRGRGWTPKSLDVPQAEESIADVGPTSQMLSLLEF